MVLGNSVRAFSIIDWGREGQFKNASLSVARGMAQECRDPWVAIEGGWFPTGAM